MPEFPWDSLKAETLRSLCRDLGMSRPSTRGAMIGFLTQVKEQGLEKAIAIESSQTPLKRKAAPALPITPSERRAGKTVSDYDTRHKRARLSDPGPGTSRKTSTRAVQNGTTDSSDKPAPKRRGRPPKTTSKLTPKTKTRKEEVSPPSAPISARREIFDGVVVPTVNFGASKGKAKAQEEMGDEDADGDIDMDHVEEQDDGRISRVESSLAGSNKENESVSGSDESAHQNSGEPVEDDAGNGPSTRVPESTVQIITVVQVAGEDVDVDAEGEVVTDEVVAEGEATVPQPNDVVQNGRPMGPSDFPILQETHLASDLTPEEVNHIEQMLRSVAADAL